VANINPWQARMKRWQKRWPVPIEELQAQAYGVLMMAYENVMVDDGEARRKHILAYFQGLTAFARLRETLALEDFDKRLTALEQATLEGHRNGAFH
jgi:hypothetical protein